jgi:8-oxo-dGTP pyrophosphatase MutT (NUDIX family)
MLFAMDAKQKYFHKRHTGRAIVLKDDHILLIERWRGEMHYFSIPGGGIEAGEDAESTALREVEEETGIKIRLDRLLYKMTDGETVHAIYLATYLAGDPHLPDTAPEASSGPDNRYEPKWVPIHRVKDLQFGYWQPLHPYLVTDLENGFSKSVKITAA